MYQRFLNNSDYSGLITEKHLNQLIREDEKCLDRAEENAEASILEYLTENYEVEKALLVGKNIIEQNRQITYPVGSHFYKDNKIWEVIRTIGGYVAPTNINYWEEYTDMPKEEPMVYLQLKSYAPGDIVSFANTLYKCLEYNGLDYGNIRIPGLTGWEQVSAYPWEANFEYNVWDVVSWGGNFYALLDTAEIDLTENPDISDNWGLIGDYDPEYNEYEFSDNEYVVFDGAVYIPTMEVNSDEVKEGYNVKLGDPRNKNLKKHIARIAIYEVHKLISPNNVSEVRITDYEETTRWLRDASKLRINPQIPRKLDEDNKPITDWQVATFQRDYDPYKNPWQI
ncbi:hypothetical protein [Bacteroides sp. 224]|uniref:hypothetical protein n=1 Tax=Bacteroides sp. 224 TaxID=2302936 RepID=UPI0013D62151|nr:hypothetical protein [Bacteroides sp. 224]NDV63903.1 hypothetical protein [Bacteroides sp. 224]